MLYWRPRGCAWAGLLGMDDPIREGVVRAVEVARYGKIGVCMITGNHRRTVERVGPNVGLSRGGAKALMPKMRCDSTTNSLFAMDERPSVVVPSGDMF